MALKQFIWIQSVGYGSGYGARSFKYSTVDGQPQSSWATTDWKYGTYSYVEWLEERAGNRLVEIGWMIPLAGCESNPLCPAKIRFPQ
ncbi:hypothetical protein P4646_19890 [Peribacillus simplex]|uniref:hypothetical protein n=1 Tax=Peribacillus simplex TaxID=1478 RepID=UPI002E1E9499|nr:hypothetical protein [Peribacillus simplex]MED4096833.1 hypothetical protein [Peribacillus simplex]